MVAGKDDQFFILKIIALFFSLMAQNKKINVQQTGKFGELFRSNPYMAKRVQALRWFADSAYFAIAQGLDATGKASAVDVDQKVADLISVF